MFNTSFKVEVEKDGDKKDVDVVIQEISPFKVSDIFSSALDVESRNYKAGTLVEMLIQEVVVSPKNLKQQIEEADNSIELISKIYQELNSFCNNPKRYVLLQKESQAKAKDMEHNNS